MIPEYGHLALIFALFIAVVLAVLPLVGTFTGRVVWMASARSLTTGMFVFIVISYVALTYSFYIDDFSVAYVANHSNTDLPLYLKVCAVWGGHEGSLLLWTLILAIWTFSVSMCSKNIPADVRARVLSVLGMVSVGFLSFMLFVSNPFERYLPNVPNAGRDLNPLLQDPAFLIHPPMLYMGYVGFSVVFAFAIAGLIGGRLDSAWARWSRPWTNIAWAFLTIGIALGSWWAYYELGWGGWWMWDPVENASFMPWLAGTALIHSLAASEKRGVFKNWTLLLAILAFSLSLLGTFLTRSGLLTSVHAFAADPARGLYILCFLFIVIGGSLTLFAFRAPELKTNTRFNLLSREAYLLANSIIMVASCLFVLLGTLFPMISEALNLGTYSVGEPYFNSFFPKFMIVVAFLMGTAVMLNWKNTRFDKIRIWQITSFVVSFCFASLLPLLSRDGYSVNAALVIFFGLWVINSSLLDIIRKTQNSKFKWRALGSIPASLYGMHLGHIGFALCFIGSGLNTVFVDQRDVRMTVGQTIEASGYSYELTEVSRKRFQNYFADIAEIRVAKDGELITVMHPEKRQYFSGGNLMTEAGIEVGLFRDIYVSVGEQINDSDWAMRVYLQPFVRWIWLGAIFMAIGGITALFDKRYAKYRQQRAALVDKSNPDDDVTLQPAVNS